MRIDPAIAALRGDPAAGRPAQAAIERALAAWRREPAVAAACAELAAYGEGGALARYPALAALVEAREAANAFVDPLLARVAGVLRRHPLAQLPFRHQAGEGVALLQLARAGRATLSLIGYDPAATRLAPRSVCFTDSHRHEICLAGRGRAQRVTLAAPTRGGAGLALADVALAPGTRMDFAGARATKIVRQVQRSVVLLRLTRVARVPGESREYRLSDGALLHRAAGTARESRRELALALLGRMARADALPLMLDAARSGSDSARWQALRECLALDSGAGFSALARIARDPADPLAGPAAALRDDLLARHPVLAAAEGEGGRGSVPRALTAPAGAPCSLEEARDALCARGFDPRDEASLHHAAGWLARLGRNRDFLGDLLVERLSTRGDEDAGAGGYGPQAIMLSGTQAGHFLRANIWPAAGDHACRTSGRHSFVYDLPHDHNFDFLTVGYFGPGYRSDYYEYDHAALSGWRGERAGLRFVERSALSPGRLLHYRAHRDVHRQLPPASLSVSLNVVAADPAAAWFDQYAFDLEEDRIDRVLNPGASEAFLHLAVGLGSGEAVELARWIGHGHPSDRLRLASFAARAASAGSAEGAERVWREAEGAGSRLVRAEAARRRAAVAAG